MCDKKENRSANTAVPQDRVERREGQVTRAHSRNPESTYPNVSECVHNQSDTRPLLGALVMFRVLQDSARATPEIHEPNSLRGERIASTHMNVWVCLDMAKTRTIDLL